MKNLKKIPIYKFLSNNIRNSNLFWESKALFSSIELFFSFLDYGFKQSKKHYQRRKLEPNPYTKSQKKITPSRRIYLKGYNSMINFKRAHYLEKAMYCETPKNKNLDLIHIAQRKSFKNIKYYLLYLKSFITYYKLHLNVRLTKKIKNEKD